MVQSRHQRNLPKTRKSLFKEHSGIAPDRIAAHILAAVRRRSSSSRPGREEKYPTPSRSATIHGRRTVSVTGKLHLPRAGAQPLDAPTRNSLARQSKRHAPQPSAVRSGTTCATQTGLRRRDVPARRRLFKRAVEGSWRGDSFNVVRRCRS